MAPRGDPGSNPAGLPKKYFFWNLLFFIFLGPDIQSIVIIVPRDQIYEVEGEILSNLDKLHCNLDILHSVYVE